MVCRVSQISGALLRGVAFEFHFTTVVRGGLAKNFYRVGIFKFALGGGGEHFPPKV